MFAAGRPNMVSGNRTPGAACSTGDGNQNRLQDDLEAALLRPSIVH